MGCLGGGGARSIFAEPPGSPGCQGGFRVVATAAIWPELGGNSLVLSTLHRSRHSRERSSDTVQSCSSLHYVKRNTFSLLPVDKKQTGSGWRPPESCVSLWLDVLIEEKQQLLTFCYADEH